MRPGTGGPCTPERLEGGARSVRALRAVRRVHGEPGRARGDLRQEQIFSGGESERRWPTAVQLFSGAPGRRHVAGGSCWLPGDAGLLRARKSWARTEIRVLQALCVGLTALSLRDMAVSLELLSRSSAQPQTAGRERECRAGPAWLLLHAAHDRNTAHRNTAHRNTATHSSRRVSKGKGIGDDCLDLPGGNLTTAF